MQKPLAQHTSQQFVHQLRACERVIAAAYQEGFEHGSRLSLQTCADKIKQDAEKNPYPQDVRSALMDVATFLSGVAQRGLAWQPAAAPQRSGDQSSDTNTGDVHAGDVQQKDGDKEDIEKADQKVELKKDQEISGNA